MFFFLLILENLFCEFIEIRSIAIWIKQSSASQNGYDKCVFEETVSVIYSLTRVYKIFIANFCLLITKQQTVLIRRNNCAIWGGNFDNKKKLKNNIMHQSESDNRREYNWLSSQKWIIKQKKIKLKISPQT